MTKKYRRFFGVNHPLLPIFSRVIFAILVLFGRTEYILQCRDFYTWSHSFWQSESDSTRQKRRKHRNCLAEFKNESRDFWGLVKMQVTGDLGDRGNRPDENAVARSQPAAAETALMLRYIYRSFAVSQWSGVIAVLEIVRSMIQLCCDNAQRWQDKSQGQSAALGH